MHQNVCWIAALCALGCEQRVDPQDVRTLAEHAIGFEQRLGAIEQKLATPSGQDVLRVTRMPLVENSTGNEVCAGQDQVCLTVIFTHGSLLSDINGRDCGYAVADCNSRVVPLRHCLRESNYVVAPIKFWPSPGMKGQCNGGRVGNQSCLQAPNNLTAICTDN